MLPNIFFYYLFHYTLKNFIFILSRISYFAHKNKASNMASYAENIGSLFDQGLFADCTIIAEDGVEFKAHKCILACRSPVFRAMFQHQMIEAKEGIAKIKDIKSPVLEQMLRFIYFGTAPKLGEMPIELYEAAVEYQLESLKERCENVLLNSIRNENVGEFLILADRYSVNNLKIRSIDFIRMNAVEVMKSDGWKMLVEGNYGDLLDQILKELVKSYSHSRTVGNENVCELLILANRHSAEHQNIKKYAIKYIKKCAIEVMKTNGWKMLVEGNYGDLLYQILNEIAKSFNHSTMGNDNVCELLILADRYTVDDLKIRSINFIKIHAKEVMKTNGWKKLVEGNHGKLIEQIMKAFAERRG